MKIFIRALTLALLAPLSAAALAQAAPTSAVRVFDSTELAMHRYSVIRRIGVQGWQSAFWIPAHRDLSAARGAVVNEAARLGADGVINLVCFDQTDRIVRPAGYFCYGNAIRLTKR